MPVPATDEDRQAWKNARSALIERESRPRFLSATALARLPDEPDEPDEAEDVRDDDPASTPVRVWRRGRAGTAIGRAVHATLQLVDLATGEGVDDLATQQAYLESIPELSVTVAALARSALSAPSVKAAVTTGRYWRELYVAAPVGAVAIEGYIDLLYETDDGLVIVDYKTDTIGSEVAMADKIAHYGRQLACYAIALEAATGLNVSGATLVFCTKHGPVEKTVPDLGTARSAVKVLVGHRF